MILQAASADNFGAAMKAIPYAGLYVFSTADPITLAGPLQALVTERGQSFLTTQRILIFTDSGHVQHMMKHRREYENAASRLCERCAASAI